MEAERLKNRLSRERSSQSALDPAALCPQPICCPQAHFKAHLTPFAAFD